MKTNDNAKHDMVARNESPRSTFRVQKPDEAADQAEKLAQELSEEQAELASVEEGLAERRAQLAQKEQTVQETIRRQKMALWQQKMDDVVDYAEIARQSTDHERTKDYFRRSRLAEREANHLAEELNMTVPTMAEQPAGLPGRTMSTSKAIWVVSCLFLASVLVTYIVGKPLADDPMNAIGQSIMQNAPIRALLSFTLTFLTFLVSVFFIRVAFPQFFRIWHNRIETERSLESLINEAPAWAVLLGLLGLFFMFMSLFASFYQAIYA